MTSPYEAREAKRQRLAEEFGALIEEDKAALVASWLADDQAEEEAIGQSLLARAAELKQARSVASQPFTPKTRMQLRKHLQRLDSMRRHPSGRR